MFLIRISYYTQLFAVYLIEHASVSEILTLCFVPASKIADVYELKRLKTIRKFLRNSGIRRPIMVFSNQCLPPLWYTCHCSAVVTGCKTSGISIATAVHFFKEATTYLTTTDKYSPSAPRGSRNPSPYDYFVGCGHRSFFHRCNLRLC